MENVKMLILDIDGTLLNSEKEITPDTEAMVHRAFRAGKQVVLSTGRSFAELEEILQHFPEKAELAFHFVFGSRK